MKGFNALSRVALLATAVVWTACGSDDDDMTSGTGGTTASGGTSAGGTSTGGTSTGGTSTGGSSTGGTSFGGTTGSGGTGTGGAGGSAGEGCTELVDVSGTLTGWSHYAGDRLPDDATLDFDGAGTVNNFTAGGDAVGMQTVSIETDPDVACNTLLSFEGPIPIDDMTYRATLGAGDLTLILRAKSLGPTYTSFWDVDIRAPDGRARIFADGDSIDFDQALDEIAGSHAFADDGDWHTYRITIQFDANVAGAGGAGGGGGGGEDIVNVWQDEVPILVDVLSDTAGGSDLRIGDGSGSRQAGALYDWIIWRTDGAFTPAQEPIPETLPEE